MRQCTATELSVRPVVHAAKELVNSLKQLAQLSYLKIWCQTVTFARAIADGLNSDAHNSVPDKFTGSTHLTIRKKVMNTIVDMVQSQLLLDNDQRDSFSHVVYVLKGMINDTREAVGKAFSFFRPLLGLNMLL